MMTFRAWLLKQKELRYNPEYVELANTVIKDTCCKGSSYDQIAVHMLNDHGLTMDAADILHKAGIRWAGASGHPGPIEHVYMLT